MLSKKLADTLEVGVGDTILIYGEFYDFYGMQQVHFYFKNNNYKFNITNYNSTYLESQLKFIKNASQRFFPFKIKGLIDKTYGKFPDGDADKLIIIEQRFFIKNLAYWSWDQPFLRDMYKADSG